MKKYILIAIFSLIALSNSYGQNLIKNPSFENYWGGNCTNGSSVVFYDSFNVTTPFGCTIKDWIRISETPDGYWFTGYDFPKNWLSHYVYPHSDSVCVGAEFYGNTNHNLREIIEGKLTKSLITNHHYKFSMYVQLFDSIPWINVGKIVGINSFSAVFTNSAIPSFQDLPIQNYTPQIQINQMVTDTQHWVLLVDTFIAAGGEQFVSIGNFKQDGQFQYQLVDSQANKPEVAYYFIDDVSLIDLDEVGIEEVEKNKLVVYPNPVSNQLTISSNKFIVNTIEITDILGRVCTIPPF
ncbi:MAG: hypothetical protein RJA07_946 [Bacteroidota bacterium]|jgi:hypothetical protein